RSPVVHPGDHYTVAAVAVALAKGVVKILQGHAQVGGALVLRRLDARALRPRGTRGHGGEAQNQRQSAGQSAETFHRLVLLEARTEPTLPSIPVSGVRDKSAYSADRLEVPP